MKNNQKGSVGLILLVLVGLAIIGFGAWQYLDKKNNTTSSQSNQVSNGQNSQSESLATYDDPHGRFSFKYDKSWEIRSSFPDLDYPPQSGTQCEGPVLVKGKSVIVIDLKTGDEDGEWCFSQGGWEEATERELSGIDRAIQVAKRVNYDVPIPNIYADNAYINKGDIHFAIEADYEISDQKSVQSDLDTILLSLEVD